MVAPIRVLVAHVLLELCTLVAATDQFYFPAIAPADLYVPTGFTLQVSWNTTFPQSNLVLWQQTETGFLPKDVYVHLSPGFQTWNWQAKRIVDGGLPLHFELAHLDENGGKIGGFNSGNFHVVDGLTSEFTSTAGATYIPPTANTATTLSTASDARIISTSVADTTSTSAAGTTSTSATMVSATSTVATSNTSAAAASTSSAGVQSTATAASTTSTTASTAASSAAQTRASSLDSIWSLALLLRSASSLI
ncbi:hypothetical protein B0A48_02452 [Cryoendolithus antarcticus]|uniref:Uncharacterized protein n=1 Tax=Cryoendolithus antarcticus TaxID=1507870 RepID=A0A1V8TP05_9PEZI|nr:hypothetical protein B0A48_02452 [Cryoendolithus antarcticus]